MAMPSVHFTVPDDVYQNAKAAATRQGITLREFIGKA
jgi:hypothetical protein